MGLGILDPLLWGEVGDLGGSDFGESAGGCPSALDLPGGDCGVRGAAEDVESAEMSGVGILEME